MYKFIIYLDKQNQFRWRLKARNGRIVADSGEGYKRKQMCGKQINKIITMLYSDRYNIVDETFEP